jgi:hypothetical protein
MPINNQSLIGKITPTVYIDQVTLESTSTNGLRVILNLVVKDKLNARFKSTWFGNTDLTKFIKIKVIQTTNKGAHNFLSAGDNQEAANLTINNVPLASTIIKDISLAQPEADPEPPFLHQYTEVDVDGNTITNFNYRLVFDLLEGVPGILSYFCFSYIDRVEFENTIGIPLPDNFPSLNGKVSSDIIFQTPLGSSTPELVSLTSAFYDDRNIIWPGPRNQKDGQWMTGFEYNADTSRRLTKRQVPNTKIQDFRTFRQILPKAIDLSMMASASFDYGKKAKILRNDDTDIYKKQSYFSNAWLSQDEKNNVHFIFGANMYELIKYKAKFGKFINNTDPNIVNEIVQECKIKSFKIVRKRIKNTPNINKLGSFENPEERFDDILKSDDVVVITGENKNTILGNSSVGSVKEIDAVASMNNLDSDYCRYFSVSDRQLKIIFHGLYQYGVEMLIEDGTIIFLKKILKQLIKENARLKIYFQEAAQEYNAIAQKYSQKFIDRQTIKYQNKSKPWIGPITIYFKALRALTNDELDPVNRTSILNILKPASGNLEGLMGFMSVYDKMISTVENLLGKSPSLRSSQGMLASSSEVEKPSYILGSAKYPAFLECKTWFTNVSVDANKLNKNGISYLGGTGGTSFRKIPILEFETIKNLERNKYNIPNLVNFSHLSPSYIQIENKVHHTDMLTLGIPDSSVARETYQEIENSILNINLDDSVNNLDITITKETELDPVALIYQEINTKEEGASSGIPRESQRYVDHEIEMLNRLPPVLDFNTVQLGQSLQKAISNNFELPSTNVAQDFDLSSAFEINWSLIQRIEVFTGFEIIDNYKILKKENWETLTDALYRGSDLKGTALLCRIVPYSNQELGIRYNNNLELPTYDKYFLLEKPVFVAGLEGLSGLGEQFSGLGVVANQLSMINYTPAPSAEFVSREEDRERRREGRTTTVTPTADWGGSSAPGTIGGYGGPTSKPR